MRAAPTQTLRVTRASSFGGEMRPPSDKSLTHRAYMLGAIASGPSRVRMPLRAEDCESTLSCLRPMGLEADWTGAAEIILRPPTEWRQPNNELDCGNSGTTIRLLSGLVASRPLTAVLSGDASLRRRPMDRIAGPLGMMGAEVLGDTPPITIRGSASLHGIEFRMPMASAQVKSCILLAALRAHCPTHIDELYPTRDHTERMLRSMGAEVLTAVNRVSIVPTQKLNPFEFTVPADISSAAFFISATALVPGSRLRVRDLSINPTRTGALEVLEGCGVNFRLEGTREELGEPVADVEVWSSNRLQPFEISGPLVPRLIDEIPVLAIVATQCHGVTKVRDAKELRTKESDRIERIADGLRAMGANIETTEDGFTIEGPTPLSGTILDAEGDHRIAMAFAVAGLIADGETVIEGAETIATSFPEFEQELRRLAGA